MSFTDGVVTVQDPASFNGNPFEYAISVVDDLANSDSGFVPVEIKKNRDQVNEAWELAKGTIDSLAGISFVIPNIEVSPVVDPSIPFDPTRPEFIRTDFGDISDITIPGSPDIGTLPSVDKPNIPVFNPSIDTIIIPNPPEAGLIQSPGLPPGSPILEFPTLDPISYPDEPHLTEITIPEFDGVTIPTFTPDFPEFQEPIINTHLDWEEPEYTREIIDSVIAKVQQMLDGGLAIDPAVEQGIVDRARDREDRLVRQSVSQAIDEIAGRGFSQPPGVLVERIDNIREEGLLKKLGLNREVMIKIFDEELANMRLAVQQGIAAEQLFVQLFLASVERLFEVEKLNIQWQLELYNLQVTLFTTRMREVEIRAQVYETQVRGALAEVEVFKALVDAERAKAEVNKSVVDAYTAQIEARKVFVDIYEAQVRAVGVQAEIYATEIQAFKGKVEAYAAEIGAEKLKFDAYEAQIRGETAKATIIESEARAYAAQVEGIGSGVTAQVAALRGEVSKIEAEIQAYLAEIQGITAGSEIELRRIQSRVAGFSADTQKYSADAGIIESENRVTVAAWDAANRTNIAFYEAQVAKFRTQVEALARQAEVALGALRATGDITSTVTAGALAAMHLGATINAGSNVGANGSQSQSFGETIGQSTSKSCTTGNSLSVNATTNNPVAFPCDL